MGLDEGGKAFGAAVLLKHARALEAESGGVREGKADIEYIHRMRVASRRLRAALPLFKECLPAGSYGGWTRQVRAVTRALGEARDADVQIERVATYRAALDDPILRAGLARLELRLHQKRAALQPGLSLALEHFARKGTLTEMTAALAVYPALEGNAPAAPSPALMDLAWRSIGARLEKFLSFDAIVPMPEQVEALHRMRIAAKSLRYTMETFAPLYPDELRPYLKAVRESQEVLGAIHDCDVWTALIPVYLEEERARVLAYFGHTRPYRRLVPGVERFAAERQAEREDLHRTFTRQWTAWMERELWGRLRDALMGALTESIPPGETQADRL